jgi:tRNA 2-thiouridine synthesizing protein B
MLHLIFSSLVESSLLERIGHGDDVVFMENAVYRLYKDSCLSAELIKMLNNNIALFVLTEQLETRGLGDNQIITGVRVIDYLGLVKLTEKNTVIRSWN